MLLRLEHLFQKGEDHELSRPVIIDLKVLYRYLKFLISEVIENFVSLRVYSQLTKLLRWMRLLYLLVPFW